MSKEHTRVPRLAQGSEPFSLALLALLINAAVAHAGPPQYVIRDLGAAGGVQSRGLALAEDGKVAGTTEVPPAPSGLIPSRGFLWQDGAPGMVELGSFTGPEGSSGAFGIGAGSTVVGRATGATGWRPFRYRDGSLVDLGNPTAGFLGGEAHGINSAGEIAGWESSEAEGGTCKPLLWLESPAHGLPAGANVLPLLPTFASGQAQAVNSAGEVVGWNSSACTFAFGSLAGFLWLPAAAHGLPAGVHALAPGDWAAPLSINDLGQVVGVYNRKNFQHWEPFLWENGVLTLIPLPSTPFIGVANDINNLGDIVGQSDLTNAAVWLRTGGVTYDLQSLIVPADTGLVLSSAASINDAGEIAGTAIRNGVVRAVLLQPAAENLIFVDGFESGTTAAWSVVVP